VPDYSAVARREFDALIARAGYSSMSEMRRANLRGGLAEGRAWLDRKRAEAANAGAPREVHREGARRARRQGQALKNANGEWSYPIGDESDLLAAILADAPARRQQLATQPRPSSMMERPCSGY